MPPLAARLSFLLAPALQCATAYSRASSLAGIARASATAILISWLLLFSLLAVMSFRCCALPLLLLLLLQLLVVIAPVSAAEDCVSIVGFSGCSWSSCGVVHNCVGGDILTITGSGFSQLQPEDFDVSLNNQFPCSNASVTADGRLRCTLPNLSSLYTVNGRSQTVQVLNSSSDLSLICKPSQQNPFGVFYAYQDVRQSATGVTGAAASCSWSSGAPANIPFVQSVKGCNPADADATTGCDGSGKVTLTIRGLNFSPAAESIIVQGAVAAYSCTPTFSTEQTILCSGLLISASDLNTSLPLYVSNGLGYWSDQPVMLSFASSGGGGGGGGGGGSSSSGGGDNLEGSGAKLSSVWLIVLSCVLGVVVIGGLILCALSCCCGISLSLLCMRCCRARQESSQLLLASQGTMGGAVV
jgi:hypothetical protein